MWDALVWLYILTTTMLICHEMDSAYWKEWEFFAGLFGKEADKANELKNLAGYLVFHIPLVVLVLWGLLKVNEQAFAGLIVSLLVCGAGFFAFCIHMYGFKRGRPEFRCATSVLILIATLLSALGQVVLTSLLLMA